MTTTAQPRQSNAALMQDVLRLSIPSIMAQIAATIMQYIDATMVGSLGANASAAIGLVSSSTWLMGGICGAAATGYAVQIAHRIGAGEEDEARNVLRQALCFCAVFGLLIGAVGIGLSGGLPVWLGGAPEITADASAYFFIFACAMPAACLDNMAASALQCSGDMRTPSLVSALMCGLDVVFNFFLIFPTRTVNGICIPGAGLGVTGAALGTTLSELVCAMLMLWGACVRSPKLSLRIPGSWRFNANVHLTAARISLPAAFERIVLNFAQIAVTRIVAPLGTVAVAANSLAVTAESLCYMPGYGIAAAATTLVGQSQGAGRKDLSKRYARLATLLGAAVMGAAGALMYAAAPLMFQMLTPDPAVRALGVQVLRIEAFAEPFFAISIVAAGALRGAGDTLVPSVMNLVSMWGVRITLSLVLAPRFGLPGVWTAMCLELCARGVLFLIRLLHGKWLSKKV